MSNTPVHSRPEWLNGREAGRIAGCSYTALQRAVVIGWIRTKLERGVAPRYHAGEVAKFAEARSNRRPEGAGV
jgi:hypothetical protein